MKTYKAIIIFTIILTFPAYLYYRKNQEFSESANDKAESRIYGFKQIVKNLEGLIAYYPLDEDSGDAINRAPDTYGTLIGKVNGAKQGVEGLVGNAYSFDGVDDEVIVSYDTVIDITGNEISLFALIKLSSLPSNRGDQMQIVKHLRTSPMPGGYQLEINGTDSNYPDEIRMNVKGTDDNYISGSGVTLEINRWYFVVATYDGSHAATYINGVNDKMDDASGELLANSQDLVIGGQCNSQNNFHGLIQHVGIVNRCLSDEEITHLTNMIWEKI